MSLVPLASLALHLYGRVRLATAVSELEAVVGEKVVFDLAQLETVQPPEHSNAAVWLVAGAMALDHWSAEEIDWELEARMLPRDQWSPRQKAGARNLIARYRGVLVDLHEAAALSQSDYGIPYDNLMADFPYLLPLMRASRLLSLESRLAFADGDTEGGLLAARALARIGDSLEGVPLLIHSLIQVVCEKELTRVVHEVLESTEPWAVSPAVLGELEANLPGGAWMAEARKAVAFDASWMSAAVRHGCRQSGHWPPCASWAVRYQLGPLGAAEALGRARQVVDLVPVPYGEARARLDVHPSGVLILPHSGTELIDVLFAATAEPSFDGWRLTELVPDLIPALLGRARPDAISFRYEGNMIDFVHKIQKSACEQQLVRAAIALRQIGLTRGAYPRQRPDLMDLTEADPFTGRQIAYRPGDDGSLHLEVEGAQELTRQMFSRQNHTLDLEFFDVTLPPPTRRTFG